MVGLVLGKLVDETQPKQNKNTIKSLTQKTIMGEVRRDRFLGLASISSNSTV